MENQNRHNDRRTSRGAPRVWLLLLLVAFTPVVTRTRGPSPALSLPAERQQSEDISSTSAAPLLETGQRVEAEVATDAADAPTTFRLATEKDNEYLLSVGARGDATLRLEVFDPEGKRVGIRSNVTGAAPAAVHLMPIEGEYRVVIRGTGRVTLLLLQVESGPPLAYFKGRADSVRADLGL